MGASVVPGSAELRAWSFCPLISPQLEICPAPPLPPRNGLPAVTPREPTVDEPDRRLTTQLPPLSLMRMLLPAFVPNCAPPVVNDVELVPLPIASEAPLIDPPE